jgi:hypothetical protein
MFEYLQPLALALIPTLIIADLIFSSEEPVAPTKSCDSKE